MSFYRKMQLQDIGKLFIYCMAYHYIIRLTHSVQLSKRRSILTGVPAVCLWGFTIIAMEHNINLPTYYRLSKGKIAYFVLKIVIPKHSKNPVFKPFLAQIQGFYYGGEGGTRTLIKLCNINSSDCLYRFTTDLLCYC